MPLPTLLARPAHPGVIISGNYYDRNPTQIGDSYYANSIAPHTVTTRWSYTVPSNRKALAEVTALQLIRDGTATTAGIARIFLTHTPSGSGAINIVALAAFATATGTGPYQVVPQDLYLGSGDVLTATTADASTGGTYTIACTLKATEFDS